MVKVLMGRMADREPWWAEWWSAMAAIGWVLVLAALTPGLDAMPAFRLVAQVAPEWWWYSSSVAVAGAQIWALRQDKRRLRWWLALAMGWWWTFVTLAIAFTAPVTPGFALYATMAAINHYSVIRLRTE